jgi:hypothetical protein
LVDVRHLAVRRESGMKLVKRLAIALGSLAALMLAGGAHFKIT